MKLFVVVLLVLAQASYAQSPIDVEHIDAESAQLAPENWVRAQGGELKIQLSPDRLRALGVQSAQFESNQRGFQFDSYVDLYAPQGSLLSVPAARLPNYTLRLQRSADTIDIALAGSLRFDQSTLRGEWRDAQGEIWLEHQHAHLHLPKPNDARPELMLRYMDIKVGPALAEWLGNSLLVGELLGVGELRMPVLQNPALRGVTCGSGNWAGPSNKADVELLSIANFSQMRCTDCGGPAVPNGTLVVAPDATLQNSGSNDVPWYEKFTAPSAPYNNDQHPYLVWEMFRLEADGSVRQIGRSGVKHAFFTINFACSCPAGPVLGPGCQDVYSTATNDTPNDADCSPFSACYQGRRQDLNPNTGIFGRCGSNFDPNCDGSESDTLPYGPFENRMVVRETDILSGPGVRFFGQGMYVVRDEGNWINNVGNLEVFPQWVGGSTTFWSFRINPGPFANGTVLHRLYQANDPLQRLSVLDSEHGKIVVLARATQLSATRWRYRYAVYNVDFTEATQAGIGTNVSLSNNHGPRGLRFQSFGGAPNFSAISFSDIDSNAANNWAATINATSLQFDKQTNDINYLEWGMLFNFSFEADLAPGSNVAQFVRRDGGLQAISVLGPGTELYFSSGFE